MKWKRNGSFGGARGMQEISALIPGVKFSFTRFQRTAVARTCAELCCRRDNAYTNSNHAKHFFLFAVNSHNPSYSLTAKPWSHVQSWCSKVSLTHFHFPPTSKQAHHAQPHAVGLPVLFIEG